MASGNFISSTGTNLNLYVTWSSTTDVSANTSTVTAKVYMRSYTISGKALTNSYITINGNKKSFAGTSLTKSSNSLTDTLLTTHTVTVAHNTDGKKSITIEARLDFNGTVSGKSLDDVVASKTVNLDTIPRASSFTIPSSVNTGSNLTVTISPANSSFRHRVRFIIDGATKYESDLIAAGTTTIPYSISHAWLPNHTSRTMTVQVLTYTSSGGYIAQKESTTNVTVPSSIIPTVSSITPTILSGLSGKYVQGKSQVQLTVNGKAGDGATISSYIFTGTNINGASSSYTGTSNTKTSSVLSTSGKLTYNVQIKDSRGRISAVKAIDITVEKYASPEITSISASRCLENGKLDPDGTYAKVVIKTSYSPIGGANQRVVKLYSDTDNYALATIVIAATDTNNDYTGVYGGNFSASQSYIIKAVITDSYNTGSKISKSTTIETAARTLNIARYGNGVAVGGLSSVTEASDPGKFECNWDAHFNDSVFVTNKITCSNPYDARNFNINCYWKDGNAHDILVRDKDGLKVGLGWVGSETYPTVLDVRPTKVEFRGIVQSAATYNKTYDSSPNMYIASNGVLGRSTSSSQRYKTDIQEVQNDELNPYRVLDIPIRQYKYNEDNIPVGKDADDTYIGLIAEEVAKAYPAAAEYNEDGQVEMWNVKVIVPAMLKIIQDQQKAINELKQKVEDLEMNT